MRLELVPIPVSDVDRAKKFYEQVGFVNVHDNQISPQMPRGPAHPARVDLCDRLRDRRGPDH